MISLDLYPMVLSQGDKILPDKILIDKIFDITYDAMISVLPTNVSKEDDYKLWIYWYEQRIEGGTEYLLLFDDNILKGYIAFKLQNHKKYIDIEDLIIHPKYHGDGRTLIRLLHGFLKVTKESNLNLLYGYTSKLNIKMQRILSKSGFSIDEYTKNGIRYVSTKEKLEKRFSNIIMYINKKDSQFNGNRI